MCYSMLQYMQLMTATQNLAYSVAMAAVCGECADRLLLVNMQLTWLDPTQVILGVETSVSTR
jgi:hypothetical protein